MDDRPTPSVWSRVAIVGALASLAAGCASARKPIGSSGAGPDEGAPPPALAAKSIDQRPSGARYIADGDLAGAGSVVLESHAGGTEGEWTVSRTAAGAKKPMRIDRFRSLADGSIALVETVNSDRGVISRYDPPMVTAPALLNPGEPFEQSLTLTIHPIPRPERVQDRGPARSVLRLRSGLAPELSASSAGMSCIESEFTADLGAAHVEARTTRCYASSGGMVSESHEERATALGIVVSSRKWTLIRPPDGLHTDLTGAKGSVAPGGAKKPADPRDDR